MSWREAKKHSLSRQDLKDIRDKAQLRPEEHRTGWFLKVVCSGDWQPRSVTEGVIGKLDCGGIVLPPISSPSCFPLQAETNDEDTTAFSLDTSGQLRSDN